MRLSHSCFWIKGFEEYGEDNGIYITDRIDTWGVGFLLFYVDWEWESMCVHVGWLRVKGFHLFT